MLEGRYENLHFFTSRNVKIENTRETLVIVNDLVSCLLNVNDIWDEEDGNGSRRYHSSKRHVGLAGVQWLGPRCRTLGEEVSEALMDRAVGLQYVEKEQI